MRAHVWVRRNCAPILVAASVSAGSCGGQPVGFASWSAGRPLAPLPDRRADMATGQSVRGGGSQAGGDKSVYGGAAWGNAPRPTGLPASPAATTAVHGPVQAESVRVGEPVRQPIVAQAEVLADSEADALFGAVERCDTRRGEALPGRARRVEPLCCPRGLPRWSAAGQDGRDACHFDGPAGAYAGGREGDGTVRGAVAGSRETGCRMDGGP